jgi:acyl carrier protein
MNLNMTPQEFQSKRNKLEKLIRDWWKEEQGGWSIDKKPKKEEKSDIMSSSLPVIDSKIAITVSTALEDILGAEIHPSLIKKGGYESIDELVTDLLEKLSDCCNQKQASGQN